MVKSTFNWIESQKLIHFIDINLGSWSDVDLRAMAQESGLEELYKFGFVPSSAAVHGSWNHTGLQDVRACRNPLHKRHMIGVPDVNGVSVDYLFLACEYFDRFFDGIGKFLHSLNNSNRMQILCSEKIPNIISEIEKKYEEAGAGV